MSSDVPGNHSICTDHSAVSGKLAYSSKSHCAAALNADKEHSLHALEAFIAVHNHRFMLDSRQGLRQRSAAYFHRSKTLPFFLFLPLPCIHRISRAALPHHSARLQIPSMLHASLARVSAFVSQIQRDTTYQCHLPHAGVQYQLR